MSPVAIELWVRQYGLRANHPHTVSVPGAVDFAVPETALRIPEKRALCNGKKAPAAT
jgi:hypothetical protein